MVSKHVRIVNIVCQKYYDIGHWPNIGQGRKNTCISMGDRLIYIRVTAVYPRVPAVKPRVPAMNPRVPCSVLKGTTSVPKGTVNVPKGTHCHIIGS